MESGTIEQSLPGIVPSTQEDLSVGHALPLSPKKRLILNPLVRNWAAEVSRTAMAFHWYTPAKPPAWS